MNKNKLLSIAIPTWNRAQVLNQSLSFLLPQVDNLKEYIQFIISDNNSDDNTNEIILKFKQEYKEIEWIHFRQDHNTGYFGNFKKCRELSTGKYLWLLSDNEFVLSGVLQTIIDLLNQDKDIGIISLFGWLPEETKIQNKFLIHEKASWETLLRKFGHKITGMSANIMLNIKNDDLFILNSFKDNSFLGFILLLNVGKYSNNIEIVTGPALISKSCDVRFDVFKIWCNDFIFCIKYIETESLVSGKTLSIFVNEIIKTVLYGHLILAKLNIDNNGRKYTKFKEIRSGLKKGFSKYKNYWIYLFPLGTLPKQLAFLLYYSDKIIRKSAGLFTKDI